MALQRQPTAVTVNVVVRLARVRLALTLALIASTGTIARPAYGVITGMRPAER